MPPRKRALPDTEDDDVHKDFRKRVATYAHRGSSYGSASKSASASRSTPLTSKDRDSPAVKEEDEDTGSIATKNTLMWFRNDLRLQDNRALYAASMRSKVGAKCLIGLYIISEEEWAEHDEAPVKIDFWMRNLTSLKESMDKLAIPLVVKTAEHKTDIISIVESLVQEMEISHVFWNAELMIDERRRDAAVKKALSKLPNVHVEECDDQCVVNPLDVKTKVSVPCHCFHSDQLVFVLNLLRNYRPGTHMPSSRRSTTLGAGLLRLSHITWSCLRAQTRTHQKQNTSTQVISKPRSNHPILTTWT